ncbi:hypothetical protein J3459_017913 [Metarhizium acridum]|nr:hypothetical protein J3459_017913 [Metarhizium acridum]
MGVFEALFLLFASQALAAPVDSQEGTKNAAGQNGILHLPLVPIAREVDARDIAKREISTPIDYFKYEGPKPATSVGIVLEIGQPPQKVIVEPDTGSSKFWVLGVKPGDNRGGAGSTYFDMKLSTSLQDLKKDDGAAYGGGSERVNYALVTDEVSIGGTSLGSMQFGVGNLSSPHTSLGRNVGIMGLLPNPKVKDFILDKLLEKNLVKSRTFSFSLREKGKGALSFGGYDTSKFSGPLEKFAMQPSDNKHFIIQVQSVLFNNGTTNSTVLLGKQGNSGKTLTMGLDSGAPALQVSMDVAKNFADGMGGAWKSLGRIMEFPCDAVDAKASIDFKMSDKTTVSIPLLDLVTSRLDNGKTCQLAVQAGKSPADLWTGGHFLRRSTVVYDPDNASMYVARGADCGSSLVAIDGKMPDNVVGKCNAEVPDSPAGEPPTTTDKPVGNICRGGQVGKR